MKLMPKNLLPKDGEYTYFDYESEKIEVLVYNKGGDDYLAYVSFCPHFGGKLEIKDDQLYCPFHGYKFDLDEGKCQNRELGSKCQKVNVVNFEEDYYVDIS